MNGAECGTCGYIQCKCKEIDQRKEKEERIKEGRAVAEIGIDVFSKVKRRRMRIIKWLWPDLQRLSEALYDYWDKS